MSSSQLTLQFDASLVERYRCVRDVVAAGVYKRGLHRTAPDLEMAPGNLSAALAADGRCLSCDAMEKYIEATGDKQPVLYLIAKYIGTSSEEIASARQERIEHLLAEVKELLGERPMNRRGKR